MSEIKNNCKFPCRDKLLEEYRNPSFNPQSKIKNAEDGNKYLPLKEKIRMFRSDNPEAFIECRVLVDNNLYASVECRIESSCGSAVAVGKWYHTNTDVFGKNYLSTAQSNAISNALKLLGYDDYENEDEPSGELNIGPVEQLPFILDDNQEYVVNPLVKEGSKKEIGKNFTLSVNQARTFRIPNVPFGNRTIGDILDNDGPDNIAKLKDILNFAIKHNTPLINVAKVILPLLEA